MRIRDLPRKSEKVEGRWPVMEVGTAGHRWERKRERDRERTPEGLP